MSSGGGGGGSSYDGGNTFFIKNVEYRIVSEKKKIAALVWTSGKKTMIIPALIKHKKKTYKVVGIDARAFRESRGVRSVTIGKNVKMIRKQAFAGCSKLRNITIQGENLTGKNIGKDAFKGVKAKLILPEGCEEYKKMLRAKGLRIRK